MADRQLILTVTRACNLRCAYCPTAKDGWPSLAPDEAVAALTLFAERFGGGDVKLFGGEPLLVPDVVRAVFDAARTLPAIKRVYLSTNGLGLDDAWLDYLASHRKSILTLSMDGDPADHRRFRRGLPGVPDSYAHIMTLLPRLLRTPRLVITQTVPPATAGAALRNFDHLRSLGLRRFNLLPGYYLPWRPDQLAELREGLAGIGDRFVDAWRRDERLYLRNLFTWAPTPFFNTGLVVDSDGTIHPSNVGLSGALDHLREETTVGTLREPPTPAELDAAAERVGGLLRGALTEHIWQSTLAADGELSALCRRLYPEYFAMRRRRGAGPPGAVGAVG
jgi:MoaA/NifB/PqqE/SkfB family radical SAM enzyme